ncbi:BrnT family toxin [Jiella endophytica]|uniref:BrnT family toxin n=1 Tax=Jiella endophytica TaxID=2558362 RepID=A0A4Y8RH53_9HYPH|nr:BrnT family toxin [Jiella endophytica]TFF21821.1 BrnT family toxin [Jiella endophytica]
MRAPRRFEWDDAKAARIEAERGISVALATAVFDDPDRLDMVDDRQPYGEERRITIGEADGLLLTVVYTMRGAVCRIITVWPASRKQRSAYRGKL